MSAPVWAQPASAQSIFCPSGTVSSQIGNATGQPYSLQGGNCTNGPTGAGAFSGAALASQALSGLSQTSTTETNRSAAGAVANRREQEQQRSNSANQAATRQNEDRAAADRDRRRRRDEDSRAEKQAAAAQARRASARAAAARARQAEAREDAARKADADAAVMAQRARARAEADRAAKAEARADRMRANRVAAQRSRRDIDDIDVAPRGAGPRPLVRKGYDPEPVPVLPAYGVEPLRYGAFAQGFGDFEQRSGRASSTITYDPTNGGGGAQTFAFDILQKSTTRTAGFLGGIDLTTRNAFDPGDGLIFGVLGGYIDTSINIATRTLPAAGSLLPAAAASTKVSLSGPSVGVFATYFNGGFSFDQTLKLDFYRLNQTFSETAGFVGNINGNFGGALVGLTSAGNTDVTQFSAIGNLNYRYAMTDTVWFEPTVGYQFTNSGYGANAALLGLTDGYLVRVQGGARIGLDTYLGNTRLTTILTGLAYENVVIEGGFIQAGAFGSNTLALNDERKLRGQGILTFALDHGNGLSTFVQGDVRGGDRYFAAGGRAGVRYQW